MRSSPLTQNLFRLSLNSGNDDYFSSDIDDTKLAATFGRINKPTMIMPSENDEMIPSAVNKRVLLQRWVKASPSDLVSQLSDLVPGADHTLSAIEAQQWFSERVVRFLLCFGKA